MEQQEHSFNSNLNQKNLPNATASLVLGIISIAGIFSFGSTGLICGIIGLGLANHDKKLYKIPPEMYLPSSLKTSKTGRTCSIIGIIISIVALIIVTIFILG